MAYLGKYIRQILSKQEDVILPGFGSLTISQGSSIAIEKGRIDPPGAVIRFDGEHPKEDGKLAAEYALGENIDPDEARQQVLELVDAIKFKLDKGEQFSLELVGVFTRDDENRIRFDKDPNWIIDPDLFGLPSLDLLELEEEEIEKEKPDEKSKPTKKKSVEKPELIKKKSVPVQKEPTPMKKKMAKRAPVNKWKIIWIIVGTLIIVLVTILLIPTKNNDYGIEFSRDGIVLRENTVSDDLRGAEVTNQLVTEEDNQVEQDKQEAVSPVLQKPVEMINNFFIIAGSFQGLQNATELMESLKDEGFPAEIIVTDSRLYRVAVQSYPEKQKAVDDLVRIKAHPGLGSCWIWSR